MRALHLDFLHPGGPRLRIGAALLALGIVATASAGWRYYALAADVARLEERVEDLRNLSRRSLPKLRTSAGDAKVVAQEVGRANAVLASLTLPWDAMFGELEAAANPNVALLGIQPDGSGRQVRLAGEARRFEDLLAYVARLEGTAGFANVYLAGHELKTDAVGQPVAFTLTADWVGRR
jgi:Tfp pilus assembly protein PilN